ncbi:MAG: PQQ-dependent sugar dehydrogenase [Anaerolineae bacterium]
MRRKPILPTIGAVGLASTSLAFAFATLAQGATEPDRAPSTAILRAAPPLVVTPNLSLEPVDTGFSQPVDIAQAGDERLFIVEQAGAIQIISDGTTLDTSFLDITALVLNGGERGLLGLAFHPDYTDNGFFYVNYTCRAAASANCDNDGDTIIARYTVSGGDPNLADPNSAQIILVVGQPFSNHNAGDLNFGPDGYLYIGLGDGGSGGDPGNRAQNPGQLLGKMLRIDVDNQANGKQYAIPPGNPFITDPNTLDEIWAFGLRNPWRFSFDRTTGDMFIADVGQNTIEEISYQAATTPAGLNFGWRCKEGANDFNTSDAPCDDPNFANNLIDPIGQYDHDLGCSVTGGYVYRGSRYPVLFGYYLFADYCSGNIWSLFPDGNGGWGQTLLADPTGSDAYSTFGEGIDGELYLADHNSGVIYHIRENTVFGHAIYFPIIPK